MVGGLPTELDLFEFADVCSKPGEHAFSPTKGVRHFWWALRNRRAVYAEEVKRCANYVEDYGSAPRAWSKNKGEQGPASPWPLLAVVQLMSSLGMSEQEAWDTSPGVASWYIAAGREVRGEIELMTDKEARIVDMMKEEEA